MTARYGLDINLMMLASYRSRECVGDGRAPFDAGLVTRAPTMSIALQTER